MIAFAATLLSLLLVQGSGQSVQGIVVRAGTSDPLSKALVELRTETDAPMLDGNILDRATTEEDGRFVFTGVRPGRYRIIVTRRGYSRAPLSINVAPGQPASEIRLAMNPTGAISGHVYDAGGQPIGNVEVQAFKATYPGGRRTLTLVQTTVTNDLGEYRLFWLAPGRYYVAAGNPAIPSPFRLMGLGGTFAISAPNSQFFSGNSTSDPAVADLSVLERESTDDPYVPTFFGGSVDEDAAAVIDVRPSSEFSNTNIVIAPARARHVRGTVVDGMTGRRAEYASVRSEKPQGRSALDRADANRDTGTFDIMLLPGTHALSAQSASGTGYVVVKVADTDIDGLTIVALPDFDVHGRIVVEGRQGENKALEGLRISLRRDSPVADPITNVYSNPLPNGSLTLAAAVGDFRVNVAPILNVEPTPLPVRDASLQNAYVKSIRLGDVDVLNGNLHLEHSTDTPLEIVIGTNPGAINGHLAVQNAANASDLTVVLLPNYRRRTDLYRSALTDGSAQFRFDRLPPGDYKVFAWQDVDEDAWYDPEFMRIHENEGVGVRVVEGRAENVEVKF